tara:strand:+ start:4652 stop:4840 length:189 start_codon:yes stop_codon:yes gene_type:complete
MTINILKTLKSPTSKEKWGEWRDSQDAVCSQKNFGHQSDFLVPKDIDSIPYYPLVHYYQVLN